MFEHGGLGRAAGAALLSAFRTDHNEAWS